MERLELPLGFLSLRAVSSLGGSSLSLFARHFPLIIYAPQGESDTRSVRPTAGPTPPGRFPTRRAEGRGWERRTSEETAKRGVAPSVPLTVHYRRPAEPGP